MLRLRRLAVGLAALAPGAAFAHAIDPADLAVPWAPELWIAAPVAISAAVFAIGFARLRRRSHQGKGNLDRKAWLFGLGLAVLAGAVLSPLHQLGGRSFTAHMLEHELMMLAAAPLLVAARPLGIMIWAFGAGQRQALGAMAQSGPVQGPWRVLSEPFTATAVQAAALWLWHLPMLFDAALASEGWHAAQHLSFFVSALFFWSAMLGPRRSVWTAAVCLFVTSMISGALGALMSLSESPWYARYAALGMTPFHISPSEDQQLAGLLMWVPGGLVHAIAAMVLLSGKLREGSALRGTALQGADEPGPPHGEDAQHQGQLVL